MYVFNGYCLVLKPCPILISLSGRYAEIFHENLLNGKKILYI